MGRYAAPVAEQPSGQHLPVLPCVLGVMCAPVCQEVTWTYRVCHACAGSAAAAQALFAAVGKYPAVKLTVSHCSTKALGTCTCVS